MFCKYSPVVAATVVVLVQAIGTLSQAQERDESLARIRARLAVPTSIVSLAPENIQEVQESKARRDAPWNGFLVGAVLGAAIGFATYTPCEPQPPARICEGNLTNSRGMETVAGAALFGAIGLTVDLLMNRSPSAHRSARSLDRRFQVTASPERVSARFVAPF